jgi:alcohol dehydrogenase (NADP+)
MSLQMPVNDYLALLRPNGEFIQVGIPDGGLLTVSIPKLLRGAKVGGSFIASPQEIRQMFDLVAEKGIHSWIEQRSMKDANKAIVDMEMGLARYRYVLVNEQHP